MYDTPNETDPISAFSLSEPEIGFYKQEGWLLMPGLLKSEAVTALRNDVLGIVRELGIKTNELSQASDASYKLIQTAQYMGGSRLDGMINSPRLRAIAASLLGGDAHLYMPFSAVKSAQGGGQFHFHQDNNYTQFENGMHGINIWFALNDMTPENGCLCIEPRTHTDGTIASKNAGDGDHHRRLAYDPTYYLPVRMHAGDAVAFSRVTVHGSGENSTDDPRVAYAVQFHHEDAKATWEGGPLTALKGANRWQTAPVDEFTPAKEPDDG